MNLILAVDFDDGAEYGDSDREGQDDEAAEPDSDEVSNDEGLGSDEERDLGNLTLDNIDDMFNKMHTETRPFSDEEDEKEAQEERQKRKERIKNILQAHTQVPSKIWTSIKLISADIIFIR